VATALRWRIGVKKRLAGADVGPGWESSQCSIASTAHSDRHASRDLGVQSRFHRGARGGAELTLPGWRGYDAPWNDWIGAMTGRSPQNDGVPLAEALIAPVVLTSAAHRPVSSGRN
jgi:hypothetical protein